MKSDTVNLFKHTGNAEGAAESARGAGKSRKGQGSGGLGGASEFARLLGHTARTVAAEDHHPLAVPGEHAAEHQAEQQAQPEAAADTLRFAGDRAGQPAGGSNKQPRIPAPPAPVRTAEPRPTENASVAAQSRPTGEAPPALESRPSLETRPTRTGGPGVVVPLNTQAPALPASMSKSPPEARGTASSFAAAPSASPAAVAPLATPAAPARTAVQPAKLSPSAVGSPAVAPPQARPAARPAEPSPARQASVGSTGAHAPERTAAAPEKAAVALARTAVAPEQTAVAADKTGAAPDKAAAALDRTAALARSGTPAVPVTPAPAQAASTAARVLNPAPPASNQVAPSVQPEASRPSLTVSAPERRPAAVAPEPRPAAAAPEPRPAAVAPERRAPAPAAAPLAQATTPAAQGNTPVTRPPAKQGDQAALAGAPIRAPQHQATPPAIRLQPLDQPVADKPATSDLPPPAVSERDPAPSGPPGAARAERRPVRLSRSDSNALGFEERRPGEAPPELGGPRPLPQKPAMSSFPSQPEIVEAQPEIRRSADAQPGVPVAGELAAARSKLVRPRERAPGDDDVTTDDRKPVRMAVEKDIPNLLLLQLSAPAPAPAVELVNARLQVMAREGRRGLESAAIAAAGAGALLEAPGTDASKAKNERELPWQGPGLTLPQDATLPASLNPNTTPVLDGPAAPPLPPAAAPLLDQAALDPGLNVAVMSKAAHMTITNDDGRALELHLRMSPEGADIRASGNLAPMVQARVAELGMALASQGLTLGSFEMSRDGSGRSSRDGEDDRDSARGEDDPAGRRSVRASSPTGGGSVTNVAGRIHVKV